MFFQSRIVIFENDCSQFESSCVLVALDEFSLMEATLSGELEIVDSRRALQRVSDQPSLLIRTKSAYIVRLHSHCDESLQSQR